MEPFYADESVTLHLGDCLDVLPGLPDASVDSCVTDPPYGLAELSSARVEQALRAWLSGDRTHVPDGRGFMGRAWDRFVPPPGAWDEVFRVLKPGGYLLAFAAPRTQDLMGLSIRLAGFEVTDSLHWISGQGFPKSLDISKAIDKTAPRHAMFRPFAGHYGKQRTAAGLTHAQVCEAAGAHGETNHGGASVNWERGYGVPTLAQWVVLAPLLGLSDEWLPLIERAEADRKITGNGKSGAASIAYARAESGDYDITAPATPEAARWDGWGTALKPSHEPIILARKPLTGTVASNVLKWGTGGLNIAACSVTAGQDWKDKCGSVAGLDSNRNGDAYGEWGGARTDSSGGRPGRWPPNLLLTHDARCQPAGTRRVRGVNAPGSRGIGGKNGIYGYRPGQDRDAMPVYTDADGLETVESTAGCVPGCPVAEMDAQSGYSSSSARHNTAEAHNRTASMGRSSADWTTGGHDDAGGGSRFFPCFRYQAKASSHERPRGDDGTAHPTVKPLDLIRWLVRLVTPPGGLVLDPFAGSGTTGEACVVEGFRCVLVEHEERSARLAVKRLSKPIQPVMFGDFT